MRKNRLVQKIWIGYWVLAVAALLLFIAIVAPLGDHHTLTEMTTRTLAFIGLLSAIIVVIGRPYTRRLAAQIAALNEATTALNAGDLRHEIDLGDTFAPDEVDHLSTSIAEMLRGLRDLVMHLQTSSRQLNASALTITETAGDLTSTNGGVAEAVADIARSAERQSELVSRASTLMVQIATGIEKSASAAEAAARAVAETHTAARTGTEVANLAVDKLHQVFERVEQASLRVFAFGETSEAIGKIVDVITQLSERTNLLALNATIEAARAGDYGRGFAVVADEVRKLSESSGASAEQITQLLRALQDDSALAVAGMREATTDLTLSRDDLASIIQSLDGIVTSALRGAEKAEQIARSAAGQLQGSKEMVQAIQNIRELARQNVGSTDEVQRAISGQSGITTRMSHLATGLNDLSRGLAGRVAHFQLAAQPAPVERTGPLAGVTTAAPAGPASAAMQPAPDPSPTGAAQASEANAGSPFAAELPSLDTLSPFGAGDMASPFGADDDV